MPFYRSRSAGEVYVPEAFGDIAEDDPPVKDFAASGLDRSSHIFDLIRRGGIAVLSGPWDQLMAVLAYVEKRRGELIRKGEGKRDGSLPRPTAREWEKERRRALMRLMVMAVGDRVVEVEPPMRFPYLLELTGGERYKCGSRPFFVPLFWLRDLAAAIENVHRVQALEADIVVPEKVLIPLAQQSVSLMAKALAALRDEVPRGASVLDMGSGSGCLTLLAARELQDRVGSIVATDVLPEAIAATRINVDRWVEMGKIPPGLIEVTTGGDLFAPLRGRDFDLIIFNAPWVVSPCRSRAERATHDEGQGTVARFLEDATDHLRARGHILFQYSDHSGPRVVERLMERLRDHGWCLEREWRTRIQSRRKSPKWETVLVFDICRADQ